MKYPLRVPSVYSQAVPLGNCAVIVQYDSNSLNLLP